MEDSNKVEFIKSSIAEKYRPKMFSQFTGLKQQIIELRNYVRSKRLSNLFFVGSEGSGKTSMAYALVNEFRAHYDIEIDAIEFNASDERGIDVVRNEIKEIVETSGFIIIILDEADSMTKDAQHAMRRLAENMLADGKFMIMTGNTIANTIKPIKSRFKIMNFPQLTDEEITVRVGHVLSEEKITLMDNRQKQFIIEIIKSADGDMRKAIDEVFWYFNAKDENLLIDETYFLYRNSVDEFKKLITDVIYKQSFSNVREGIISLLYKNVSPLSANKMIEIIDQWLVEAKEENRIQPQQYGYAMWQVQQTDYMLTQPTKPHIQIIGLWGGILRIFAMDTIKE